MLIYKTYAVSICAWFLKCQFGSLLQKSISNQTWFFFEFELDFYCLCSLQKSISKSNWFFNFSNLIFRNWKKIEWHSIFQKSSGDRQGVSSLQKSEFLKLTISFFHYFWCQNWDQWHKMSGKKRKNSKNLKVADNYPNI